MMKHDVLLMFLWFWALYVPGLYLIGSRRRLNLVIVTAPEVPAGGEREMLGLETLTWVPIDRRLIEQP